MPKRRDSLLAAGALAVVMAVLATGFYFLGPRAKQRLLDADARRVEDLQAIAQQMRIRPEKQLPATLAELADHPAVILYDPVSNAPYEYHPKADMTYELCANFATDSTVDDNRFAGYTFWNHPRGRYCYELNASRVQY